MGLLGASATPLVPTGPPLVLPATMLAPDTVPLWASESWGLGCPAEAVGAGWPQGEDGDGDKDKACQGLHGALAADHHDPGLVA